MKKKGLMKKSEFWDEKSVKILIGVLCLIIVGLVTFIVVDKFKSLKHEENNTVIAEDNNNNL